LAEHYLRQKNRVGYIELGYYFHWLIPAAGSRQWYRILERLADVQVRARFVGAQINRVPRRILPSRSLVLAITPFVGDQFARAVVDLGARGFDVVVVVIPAAELLRMAFPPGAEAEIGLALWARGPRVQARRVADAGVTVVGWDVEAPFDLLIRSIQAVRRRKVRV